MDITEIRTRTTLIPHEPVRSETRAPILRALFAAAERRAESLREALGQSGQTAGAVTTSTKGGSEG